MHRLCLLLPLAACSSSPSSSGTAPSFASVRQRLASAPARLLVSGPDSAGAITAGRQTGSGWESGSVALAIAGGDVTLTADADGAIAVENLEVDVESIDLPASVIDKPSRLDHVRLVLAHPLALATTWRDDDDASAAGELELELDWTLVVDGNAVPLGAQRLGPIPLAITFAGTGDAFDAALAIHASGELWRWADLVALSDLSLELRTVSD